MRKLNRLLVAALTLVVPLGACDDDDVTTPPPPTPAVGTVAGSVTVQGEGGIAGVTVQLAGAAAASTTTAADGSFSFADVSEGTYSVAITGIPAGFQFPNTSQSVTINQDGQTASVAFAGQVVRTGSISGSVTVNGTGFPGVAVALSGPEGTESKTSGTAGTFRFTGLRAGSYTVTVTNPDEAVYTFTTDEASIDLAVGESEVVDFSATMEETTEPAEISINAITQGGAPINLSNVTGQIEVALNVRRNGNVFDRVEVVIDGEIVAAQQFADMAVSGPAQQDQVEIVTLNIPTDQVRMNGDVATPVLFNGGAEVSALLYVVGEAAPVPSNEVPIVLNNPDYVVAADLMYMPITTPGAQDVNGDTWFAGDAMFTADFFLPFSGVQPEWIEFDESGVCAFDDEESSVTGGLEMGWTVSSYYDCSAGEGASEIQNDIEDWSYGTVLEGPDGTDLRIGDSMARLGAEFMLDGETRRFLRTPGDDPLIVTLPDELLMDNVAPTLFIFGDEADASPGTGTDLQVAYNVEFDQWWTQSTFPFESVVTGPAIGGGEPTDDTDETDPTSGELGVGLAYYEVRVFDAAAGTCGGDVIARVEYDAAGDAGAATYPTVLDETLTSDDTNGHILCVVGADRLSNMTAVDGADESNYFGVDDTAPVVRVWGNSANLAVADPPSPSPYAPLNTDAGGTAEGTTPVSADLNTTIYGQTVDDPANFLYAGASARDATMGWGMDALDNRAGLDDLPGQPFAQSVVHGSFNPEPCTGLDTDVGTVLSDTWVRIAGTGTPLDCGIGEAGIYEWTGMVYDRAGNVAQVGPFNYIIDEVNPPTASGMTLGQAQYTPGQSGLISFFGSDDLEVVELTSLVRYRSELGWIDLLNAPTTVADRWDDDFANVLNVDRNPVLEVPLWGRIDVVEVNGLLPPGVVGDPADFADRWNDELDGVLGVVTAEDDDFLPIYVSAGVSRDAGLNPAAGPLETVDFLSFALGGWTTATAAPWDPALIDSFITSLGGADGTDIIAVQTADTSVDEPIFTDGVMLVHNNGANDLTMCGYFPPYVETDNGVDRFYTYTFPYEDIADTPCANLPVVPGVQGFLALGVNGAALLGALPQVYPVP